MQTCGSSPNMALFGDRHEMLELRETHEPMLSQTPSAQ